jgi:hypothetical protein
MKRKIKVEDIGKPSAKLTQTDPKDFKPLPPPYDKPENLPDWDPLKVSDGVESSLDDTIAVAIPKPKSKEE